MFGRPKRTVPKPEVVTSHQSDNPLFSATPSPGLQRFRRRILSIVAIIIGILLLTLSIYGPWLKITSITVTGTRALNNHSVETVTNDYLAGQSWLVVPRNNLWLLAGRKLSAYLIKKISTKLSIESVKVTKNYPHRLTVDVTERTPVLMWTNGKDYASLDSQGILIESRPGPDPALDMVRDGLDLPLQPDLSVIVPEVAAKILELQSALKRNHFTVKEYIIPTPICPLPTPSPEEITGANSNGNTNAGGVNQNINKSVTGPANVNQEEIPSCDLLALRQKSQEIHVQLTAGALVLFDRHANLEAAVTTLTRLLSQPENLKATYIDVRFEERVYIR